jgi:hypothetical protein
MKELTFLLIGWLLGLFGPWLADLIQKPYRRAQIKRSLFIELKRLRVQIAALVYVIASHKGLVDRLLIESLHPIFTSGETAYENVLPPEVLNTVLTWSDSQIAALSNSAEKRGAGLNLKNYDAPFLSASIPSLSLFTPEFQRRALGIHAQLALINQEIDVARNNLEKTFASSLSEINHAAILSNIAVSYDHIFRQSRRLIDLIGTILTKEK